MDARWVALGVQIKNKMWDQYYYFEWNQFESERFGAVAQMCFRSPAIAEKVRSSFRGICSESLLVYGSDKEMDVYIWPELSPQDMNHIQDVTGRVIAEWIRLWTGLGVVTQFV